MNAEHQSWKILHSSYDAMKKGIAHIYNSPASWTGKSFN